MTENDRRRLNDMLEMSKEALSLAQDKTRSDLDTDKQLTLSLLKCIEMIGFSASRVSRECQDDCEPVPWDRVIEMKQQVVHTYWEIDRDWLWERVQKDITELSKTLEILLASTK